MTTFQPAPDPGPAPTSVPGPALPPESPPVAAPGPDRRPRRGRRLGPIPITPVNVVIALVLIGSIIFIAYVTFKVDDNQIPLLAVGFVACGAAWAAIAVSLLVAMWRAASYARAGRATGLALGGGFAGLAAIGCFSIAALLTLVWNT